MQQLWTPWRKPYLLKQNERVEGCIFCDKTQHPDAEEHILYRGKHCFVALNRFPYSNGHMLIIPYRHTETLEQLNNATLLEMMRLTAFCQQFLREEYRCHGFNVGFNEGSAAGAGVPEHIHLHIVPRWRNDANYMTVIGQTRIVPDLLDDTYATFRPRFDELPREVAPIPGEQLARWADKLRDLSSLGLRFSRGIYDQANYRTVQDIAMAMLALAEDRPLADVEPLREPIFSRPTPLTTGDAAIIDERGRILLIRRVDSGLWAMPGGLLEVGETPAEGTAREALEETGVACQPLALVGVFDSRHCGGHSGQHLYHFVFLCRPLTEEAQSPSHANEITARAWFDEADLPPDLAPAHRRRIEVAFRIWRGESAAYFDAPETSPVG